MPYGYVYKIENTVNGKIYIGQTTAKPSRRKNGHFSDLKNKYHQNNHLQASFNKYGTNALKFTVITWANSKEELDHLEIYYIHKYDTLNREKGYNLREGGSNGKFSLESREKMSKNHANVKGQNNPNYGKKHSLKTRIKISKSREGKYFGKNNPFYGKKHSEESLIKMSMAQQKRYINNKSPLYGKKHSEESKKKMSESRIGKKASLKHRQNNSKVHQGKGKFGFIGHKFKKNRNPEGRCWELYIGYNHKVKYLGSFEDPLTCEIVYKFVWNEIYS